MESSQLEEIELLYSDDMASPLDDLTKRVKAYEKEVDTQGRKLAYVEGQLSAPKKPPHPFFIALVTVGSTAFVAFLGWMAVTLIQHGNTLTSIRGSLLELGVTVAANNPTAPKAQADARAGLAEARKSSIPIPAPVIEQAGKSFIEAAIRAPAAWDTAIQFVNYKSTIDAVGFKLPPQSELGKQLSPDLQAFAIKEFKGQRERTFIQDAAGRILGSVDYGVIVVKPSGSFVLDGMHIEHVVFYGGNIVYRGAVSTLLKDVAFYKPCLS